MIRIVVMCDVRLYRDALIDRFARENDMRVVGTAASLSEALERTTTPAPEIAVLGAPLREGPDLMRAIIEGPQPTKVAPTAVPHIFAWAEAGAAGSVTVDPPEEDLLGVLRRVAIQEAPCSPRATAALPRHVSELAAGRHDAADISRTARETEIVGLIEEGLSNKEIAGRLLIGLTMGKTHVHNILEKLHIHRRGEAAARLRADGVSREEQRSHPAPVATGRKD